YALIQAQKLAFKGEPAENRSSGTREKTETVTPESAFKAYENFLKTAQIEIFCISPSENKAVPEMFQKSFSKISRQTDKHHIRRISPVKTTPETLTEELDVKQCKVVLNFKSDYDDIHVLRLLSIIFGETPFSKLFVNVREKLSLCYYCSCQFDEAKNLLVVDCGVEKDNIEKAVNEILHQLDEIRNGNISDEEIQNALLALDNSYTAVGDTPSSYYSWYFNMFCIEQTMTPEERFEKFRAVTKEQLIQAAASLKPDSRYYMLNKENIE
ncbi:MAG: insulinase family protein, partial [Ruminococcus sp.]|nr:insulinase family protein [Ruminococcus sp.]